MFLDTPWPEVDRRDLWHAIEQYAHRTRRYGSVPRIRDRRTLPSGQGAPAV
ncbi:hypothetical protein ABIE67_000982 [Streptomyces sp. V4I8]